MSTATKKRNNKDRRAFLVAVDLPDGVTVSEMADYILDAVGFMKGCQHPDDPIFSLEPDSVTVQIIAPKKGI